MALNPYSALGVDPKASQDEIKKSYRKLAKEFHPDLNPGNKNAEKRFKEINAAYDLIGNPENRGKYDRGETEEQMQEQARRHQQRGPFYHQTQSQGGRYSNQFDGMDDDFLRSIFEQMGRQGRGGGFERPAQDEIYQMEIDFTDAVLGAEREITLPSGKKFLVKIPPGVESGTRLRFAGKGETVHGQAADVYVILNVRPSTTFRRAGRDLEMDLPISFSQAILGGEIKVQTIDGPVLVKIPPHVNNGQKLRIKGKGVAQTAGPRGDLFVVLKIKMPKHVDEEFRKAVEEWQKRQPSESL